MKAGILNALEPFVAFGVDAPRLEAACAGRLITALRRNGNVAYPLVSCSYRWAKCNQKGKRFMQTVISSLNDFEYSKDKKVERLRSHTRNFDFRILFLRPLGFGWLLDI